MKRRDFLRVSALAGLAPLGARGAPGERPNILFITVDDMNCDSIGVFGCEVEGTSPQVDRLAGEGIRFEYAHVQVGNCVPSRNVMQTGRYPHTSGVEGFYKITPDFPVLPDLMKSNGYYTGIKGKVSHSTPYSPYAWDMIMDPDTEKKDGKGKPSTFYGFTRDVIAQSEAAGKPFYVLVNITDPHVPFYAMGRGGVLAPDRNKPTRVFTESEIAVPGFLPDRPIVRKELAHYYSSVRRADDCAGATLKALADAGADGNTLVMFLSDHGMPFPFAKTCVYHHSSRTPWIARWPGHIAPGSVDRKHMISAIDFMPTVLEAAGIPAPKALEGKSFLPLLHGGTQDGRDWIIKEYNENSGGHRHPMRAVETRKYCYIFNPWANGERMFRTATQGMATYKEMQRLAKTDKRMAERLRVFEYRDYEEFFDCEKDPDNLHNLVGDPRHAKALEKHRRILDDWMIETNDHCLEAFQHRDDPEVMEAYMTRVQAESDGRRKKKRTRPGAPKNQRNDLLSITPPRSIRRGQPVTLAVHHTIPEDLGGQLIHVTIKSGQARLDRKVERRTGNGTWEVTFDVPNDQDMEAVSFAAFIGEDYAKCLQHVTVRPRAVE